MSRIPAVIGVLALILTLAACEGFTDRRVDSDCLVLDDAGVYACTVRLDDTRRVPCLVHTGGGLSCDWAHADGADDLEGENE